MRCVCGKSELLRVPMPSAGLHCGPAAFSIGGRTWAELFARSEALICCACGRTRFWAHALHQGATHQFVRQTCEACLEGRACSLDIADQGLSAIVCLSCGYARWCAARRPLDGGLMCERCRAPSAGELVRDSSMPLVVHVREGLFGPTGSGWFGLRACGRCAHVSWVAHDFDSIVRDPAVERITAGAGGLGPYR